MARRLSFGTSWPLSARSSVVTGIRRRVNLLVNRSARCVVLLLAAAFVMAACDKLKPPFPQTSVEPPVPQIPAPKPQDPGASGARTS